jgi:DNA-binding NarL/FixJ family response regulator
MRVILVGAERERARLRSQLNGSVEIVDEFATLAEGSTLAEEVDAIIMSPLPHATARTPEGARGTFDEPLTPRELEVLELLAEGLANKGIASRLGISDQTVKFHVASLYGKLGAVNRTDAVRRAVRRGLIAL